MKHYHYSLTISGNTMTHHGTFSSTLEDVEELKKRAKIECVGKLAKWNEKPDDISTFTLYTYEGNEEVVIFKYEKE